MTREDQWQPSLRHRRARAEAGGTATARHPSAGAAPSLGGRRLRRLGIAGRVPISPAFPTFLETMAALWGMIADGSLGKAFGITLKPLILGLAALGRGRRRARRADGPQPLRRMARRAGLHHRPGGAARRADPDPDLRLWHRPHRQGADRLHHGDAGHRAELAQRGAPYAAVAARDGPFLPRHRGPDHLQDHPAGGGAGDLRRAAARLRRRASSASSSPSS